MVDTQKFANDPKRPQGADGTLQVGAVLQGRYRIIGVLGVGGMGSVYQARDMNFPTVTRNVAVKEMLNLAADPSLREMTLRNFEREANILAELSHPAIPKIYDYFSNKDRAYLVMEYINGRDLEAIVNSMPDFLPFEMVKKWALELCDVLQYLHTHQPEPIIFRDVKPSNVMIDSQGNVRLIDFGIAKSFQPNQKQTMIGTEGYSPPEQYRGDASPVGDVYAVGATFHHILTRRDPRLEPPFSFHERPIRAVNPKVPEEFEKIVMRALTYQAAERFTSAAAMKEAIEAMDKRLEAPKAASSGASSARAQGVSEAPTTDTELFESAGALKALWKFKCEDEIRSTPVVHKGVVYVGAYDNNLYAVNAADGTLRWKFPTEGGISGTPAISVEDNLVIFGSEDGKLYAVDFRTGKISFTVQTAGPVRGSVNISHGHAFIGSDDGKLYGVRLATNKIAWKVELGGACRSRPAVTSERIIACTEEGDVFGLDLSGSHKWRFKAKRAVTSSPVIVDEIAYVASQDWHVYAISVQSGYVAWRVRTGKAIIASPLVVGKVLYIGSADGYMYALDTSMNGRELWKFQTEGQIVSTAAHANDAIYFGGVDKKVYSLETKKGKLRWSFETNGPIASSPVIVDKTLYIASTDHYLYALNI